MKKYIKKHREHIKRNWLSLGLSSFLIGKKQIAGVRGKRKRGSEPMYSASVESLDYYIL
jgi:hypothetical protein